MVFPEVVYEEFAIDAGLITTPKGYVKVN